MARAELQSCSVPTRDGLSAPSQQMELEGLYGGVPGGYTEGLVPSDYRYHFLARDAYRAGADKISLG